MENPRIQFINYKGKKILLEDFSNIKDETELIALMWQAEEVVHKQPLNSLLVVVDMTNTRYGQNAAQSSKTATKSNTPYIKASTLVGTSKLMEVIIQSLRVLTGRKLVSFPTREEAYEWLIRQ
jgi:hypothetical protein